MTMKLALGAAVLFFLAAVTTPIYAEGEQHENAQPKAEEHQEHAAKPAARPQQSYGAAYHGGVKVDDTTHGGVHHSGVPQQARRCTAASPNRARNRGAANTELGRNAVATMAIESLITASACTSGTSISSGSAGYRWSSLAGIRASNTTATG